MPGRARYPRSSGTGRLAAQRLPPRRCHEPLRQALFTVAIGSAKADAAATRLMALGAGATIKSLPGRLDEAALARIAADVDVVLDCTDASLALDDQRPAPRLAGRWATGAAIRFEGQVAVFRHDRPEGPVGPPPASEDDETGGLRGPGPRARGGRGRGPDGGRGAQAPWPVSRRASPGACGSTMRRSAPRARSRYPAAPAARVRRRPECDRRSPGRSRIVSTFILVHGSWHGAWRWHRVTPLLQRLGHAVLVPDPPGHGGDFTPVGELSLQAYADRDQQRHRRRWRARRARRPQLRRPGDQPGRRRPAGPVWVLAYVAGIATRDGDLLASLAVMIDESLLNAVSFSDGRRRHIERAGNHVLRDAVYAGLPGRIRRAGPASAARAPCAVAAARPPDRGRRPGAGVDSY